LTLNGRLEKKHEPVSDIDTVVVDSLKALDPEWPIREADIEGTEILQCSGLPTHRGVLPFWVAAQEGVGTASPRFRTIQI
jgi:hypothetical protein